MKKKVNRLQQRIQKTLQLINVGIFLLVASPVFYFVIIQCKLAGTGFSLNDMIEKSPVAALTLVYVCLNPFVAYILQLMKKRIESLNEGKVVVLNLIVLILTQMLSLNVLYLCYIAYLLYRITDLYQIKWSAIRKDISVSFLFSKIGGSIILLFVSIFLFVINLQLLF